MSATRQRSVLGTGGEHRTVLSQALAPPPGYTFDAAVFCSYSVSLPVALTIPAHLALHGDANAEQLLGNRVALLHALRRVRDRIDIFYDAAALHAPRRQHALFALLEDALHPVSLATSETFVGGGIFHPKLHLMRFLPDAEHRGARPRLRLIVLSRNLTADRSWDVALTLDGEEGRRVQPGVGQLRALVERLSQTLPAGSRRRGRVHDLALALGRTEWELPGAFESVRFLVFGAGRRQSPRGWAPDVGGKRPGALTVVSPFLTADTVSRLELACTTRPRLISRDEALRPIGREILDRFEEIFVLSEHAVDDAADRDADAADAVDVSDTNPRADARPAGGLDDLDGLHAKLYLAQHGHRVTLALGSANATAPGTEATNPAARNVELLAVLEGPAGRCGKPYALVDAEVGIGEILERWTPPEEPWTEDEQSKREREARERLEAVARQLAAPGMWMLACRPAEDGAFELVLGPAADTERRRRVWGADQAGVRVGMSLRCWPVSLTNNVAADATGLLTSADDQTPAPGVVMRVPGLAQVTGLIALELRHPDAPHAVRLTLNLPVEGMPEGRFAQLAQEVLADTSGFLRYLRYLLGQLDATALDQERVAAQQGAGQGGGAGPLDGALLEPLLQALSRQPERLDAIDALVRDLRSTEKGRALVPEAFARVWELIEQVRRRDAARRERAQREAS